MKRESKRREHTCFLDDVAVLVSHNTELELALEAKYHTLCALNILVAARLVENFLLTIEVLY